MAKTKAPDTPTPPVTVEAATIPVPEVPPVVSVPAQPGPSMLMTGPQPAYPNAAPGSAGVPMTLGFAPVGYVPTAEQVAKDFQFIGATHAPVGPRGAEFGRDLADLEQRQRAAADARLNPAAPEDETPEQITARFEAAALERDRAGDHAGAAELRAQGKSLASMVFTRQQFEARERHAEVVMARGHLTRLKNQRSRAAATGLEAAYLREARRGLGLPPEQPADDPDHADLWQTVVAAFGHLAAGGDLTRGAYTILVRDTFARLVELYPQLDPQRAALDRLERLLAPPPETREEHAA